MDELIKNVGLIAAICLPLWNIPLIFKIVKRKSSCDISRSWVWGVWLCILLMFPSGLQSSDIIWRAFNIMNIILFTPPPESHIRQGMDEWLSGRGFARTARRAVVGGAMPVRAWGSTGVLFVTVKYRNG